MAVRVPVTEAQLVAAIVTALNGSTVNSGTLHAVAQGHAVQVTQHTDQTNMVGLRTFDIQVH